MRNWRLKTTVAALSQLVAAPAATFGVTLGARPAQNFLGIGPVNAAIASTDLAQADARGGGSPVIVPSPLVGAPADSVQSQITAIPNAALGTLTAIDGQEVREG